MWQLHSNAACLGPLMTARGVSLLHCSSHLLMPVQAPMIETSTTVVLVVILHQEGKGAGCWPHVRVAWAIFSAKPRTASQNNFNAYEYEYEVRRLNLRPAVDVIAVLVSAISNNGRDFGIP
jgi:hypothetical protein